MLKKIIIIAITMAVTVACATRTEKAQRLADDMIRETLADPSSYKPLKTTVDSLLDTPAGNPDIAAAGMEGVRLLEREDSLLGAIGKNMTSARIYLNTDPARSARHTKAADRLVKEVKQLREQEEELNDSIVTLAAACTGEHTGWVFKHLYSCRGADGKNELHTVVITTDKRVRTVMSMRDKNDEQYLGGVAYAKYIVKKAGL